MQHIQRLKRFGYFQITSSGLLLAMACTAAQSAAYPTAGACVDLRAGPSGFSNPERAQGFSPAVAIPVTPAFAPQASQQSLAYAPQARVQTMPSPQMAQPMAYQGYPAQAYTPPVQVAQAYRQPYPAQVYARPYAAQAMPQVQPGPGGVITPEQRRLQELNQQYPR